MCSLFCSSFLFLLFVQSGFLFGLDSPMWSGKWGRIPRGPFRSYSFFFLLNFQRKNITSNRTDHSIEFNEFESRDHFLLMHGYYPLLDIYLRQYIYFEFTSRLLPDEFSFLCLIRPKQTIEITFQPLHSPRIKLMILWSPMCRCG